MDARGTLGVSREAKVGLGDIDVVAELDTDADDATLAKLAQLTERYCVVAQTLASTPHLTIRRAAGDGPCSGSPAAGGRVLLGAVGQVVHLGGGVVSSPSSRAASP